MRGIHQHAARHNRFSWRNIRLLVMISGQNVVAGEGGAHVGHAVGLPHALTSWVLVLLLNGWIRMKICLYKQSLFEMHLYQPLRQFLKSFILIQFYVNETQKVIHF